MIGAYRITFVGTCYAYVGISTNVPTRARHHVWALRAGKHVNQRMQRVYDKYGEGALRVEVLFEGDNAAGLAALERFVYRDAVALGYTMLNVKGWVGEYLYDAMPAPTDDEVAMHAYAWQSKVLA